MAPLPRVTYAEVERAFRRLGFVRVKGSNRWKHQDGRTAVLHLHPAHEMRLGTLRRLLTTSGVTDDEYIQVLR